ncbi:alpha-E domain-containing protein [Nocardia mexicana]|uniref:Putative alpha-E superfamily protein n=1 Tax=Nocardia mexicana TaxID=279262 RepID=A0A370HGH0_9NOCA|nr:alpha-E domain-containing protein [Nocardia mexicana]RDI54254.1 putative alpha-E superfamily protein [Nocardia mexicana]
MLARNAESLYWIGRYVERADDTARILDVAVHQLLEDATVDPDRTSRVLLRVLGIEPPDGELDVWSVTNLVGFSYSHGGSIVDSIVKARENARGAREVVSSEMWECLNATYNGLAAAEKNARALGPHEFFHYISGRAAMFAGLSDSTLSRDDGYRFLLLGRSVERVDMTVRLLLSRAGDRTSSPAWVTVLRSAGAHDTYLRTHRGALDANLVVEFILLDRLFPRSVFHSLRVAEGCLQELDRRPNSRFGARHEAARLLGRGRSELEFLPPGILLEDLQTRLLLLQQTCRQVSEAVARQYFHAAPWVAWTDLHSGHEPEEQRPAPVGKDTP